MTETQRPKSRWCEKCKYRHDVKHEHFKDAKRDRTADTITGSKSAEDLAAKAEQGRPSTLQTKLTLERLKAEQDRELREALERRWGRRMKMVYGMAARICDDKTMRLTEEEEKDFGQVHADFAIVWGIAASTKLEATFDVLTLHGTAIAARSKWVREALEGLKGKKDEESTLPPTDPRIVQPIRH